MTSEHLRTGKEYDAALIWTEDVTKDSFKVCLRELQNFDGKHEDIIVVCDQILYLVFLNNQSSFKVIHEEIKR